MIKILPQTRGRDEHGAGYFGASRGHRIHRGVDFAAKEGEFVRSFLGGRVSKLGFPYESNQVLRYVEIVGLDGNRLRYFYVFPSVILGQEIEKEQVIGTVQLLPYSGITAHYHFEVKTPSDEYLDPIRYLSGDIA